MSNREATLRAGMMAIWAKSLPHVRAQLDTLERAAMAIMDGSLDEELRRDAEREAHRLAGAAGSFGFNDASPIARELEYLFQNPKPDARRAAEIVLSLREQLDTDTIPETTEEASAPPAPESAVEDERAANVLIVDDDAAISEAIKEELVQHDLRARCVSTLTDARAALKKFKPAVVVLDIALGEENGLDLLNDIARKKTKRPAVLVLTASDQFTDRVEAVRKGARAFLQKPLPPRDIAENVRAFVARAGPEKPKILAVDDDKTILSLLRATLRKAGFDVTTLADPQRFWELLRALKPDIVLLDYDMPEVTGLDLLRVLRSDNAWRTLPVIFITSRNASETITATFESGADDFISKPIIAAELIARVRNRLERSHLLRQLAETDYLTGLMNRPTAEETLRTYQKLSERYSQPYSLAFLDIDSFTSINERAGAAAGDDVLRGFADLMRATFRGEDVVARWAGARFVIGMYGMGRTDGVHRIGEMLDGMLQRSRMYPSSDGIEVTFSAGVAQFGVDGKDMRAVMKAAEEALDRAQKEGGARVMSAGEDVGDRNVDVLIVEDDDSIAELLMHALETRGYTVVRVDNGQDALNKYNSEQSEIRPRVVLLDVDLPAVDGITVLRRWKQSGLLQHTRVIMLTVRSGEGDVVETLRLGAFDHVAKPFNTSVLMQRIRRAIEA